MVVRIILKRRYKLLLLVIGFLSVVLFFRIKDEKLEYIKDLIRKSDGNCNLDNIFNQKLIGNSFESGDCLYSLRDLSFLIGMYEISQDSYYMQEAQKIFEKYSKEFDTPSGIPRIPDLSEINGTVNVDIFSKYALEYYYLGDYSGNSTYTDTVDRGLTSISSLLQINRTVDQVNIINPFKSKNSHKPSKLYTVLFSLYSSTGIKNFNEMYVKSVDLIIPNLKNLSREECYFPIMLMQDSEKSKVGNHLLEKYCLKEISSLGNCGNVDFELYFYMFRLTKKSYWRELGWEYLRTFGSCLEAKDLRFAYLLFSTQFSLDQFIFSNGFPISKRGFGTRKRWLPVKHESCLDCIDGYALDSLLNGAFLPQR
jgi:hypothetical protein